MFSLHKRITVHNGEFNPLEGLLHLFSKKIVAMIYVCKKFEDINDVVKLLKVIRQSTNFRKKFEQESFSFIFLLLDTSSLQAFYSD